MTMIESIIAGRKCRFFGSETPECVLVQPSARHENGTLEAEVAELSKLVPKPFLLVTIELEDWTIDLMPWPDGNISRDPEAGKHGQETLGFILEDLIPELESRYGDLPVILGGYSLGGLFALWASCQSARFRGIAAASPSVWIHGWRRKHRQHGREGWGRKRVLSDRASESDPEATPKRRRGQRTHCDPGKGVNHVEMPKVRTHIQK